MDIASLPDAIALGSIPELTNPAEPLTAAIGEVAAALDGIKSPMAGMSTLLDIQAEAPVESPQPLPSPAPLEWVKQPSPEELLKAGLPIKNLLNSGSSVETLIKAGATVLDLRQVGVSADALTSAGVSLATLAATEQSIAVLSILETLPRITLELIDDDGIPYAGQAYHITKSDNSSQKGYLDDQGQCQIEVVAGATFTITFPNLDGGDWDVIPPALPLTTPPETTQLAFALVDEDGHPLAHQEYQITLPDGAQQTRRLDAQGKDRIEEIAAGVCSISFLNLDAADWQFEETAIASMPASGWLAFEIISETGSPLTGIRYELRQGETLVHQGVSDQSGQVFILALPAGLYSITFPELDAEDWQIVSSEFHSIKL